MAQIRLDREKNRLLISPQGEDDFTRLMKLPSRRWMARAKTFVVPATRMNCAQLLAVFSFADMVNFDPEVVKYIQQHASTTAGDRPFPKWYGFKSNPFPDQFNAVHKCYKNNAWALFMRMGAGKSKAAIDLVTAAFYERVIDSVVLICPNAVKPVWLASDGQIASHSPCPTLKVDVEAKFEAADIPVDAARLTWLVVGIESFSQGGSFDRLVPFVENHKCAVIVDESSRIKNPKAIRTQRTISLGKKAAMKGVMTGTSVTKLILDLFGQFEFLGPDIIGTGDFYAFRNRYAIMGGYKMKKVVGYDNIDELMQLIAPYVYICDKPAGLPAKLFTKRHVKLSPEQKDMYQKLKKAKIPQVSVANVLNRVAKLQEIVGGFLREDPNVTVNPLTGREKRTQGQIIWTLPTDKNPKLNELIAMAEEAGDEPMVIWCKYRWEIEQVGMVMQAMGPVKYLHGDITMPERTEIIQRFQGGDVKYIVATQQVGGIGHTMTAAHLMTYYSNTHALEDRLQSEDRIHRIGQEENCLYTDLIADNTVDELIQDSIKAKKSLDEYVREKLVSASFALEKLLGEG
jgi:hypothetical protein